MREQHTVKDMSDSLKSNNPFRDRATAQAIPLPPASKNPFLGHGENPNAYSSSPSARDISRSAEPAMARQTRERTSGHRSEKAENKDNTAHSSTRRPTRASTNHARPHRPRSNSDNSVVDLRKQRKEKEGLSSRSTRERDGSSSKPRKHLDKIDRLDVTGFTIAGGFHHDGPFDACNPSRNKNAKKAPVLAFAKDSTAMTMAAGPPVQPVYFGDHVHNAESFADYGAPSQKVRPSPGPRGASFDPSSFNVEPIHGYESVGLGSTTFLEGAPASRSAMLGRTTSDNGASNEDRPRAISENVSGTSLGRKKSVLQKIRGAYRDRTTETSDYAASPPQSPHRQADHSQDYFGSSKGQANTITFQVNDIPTNTVTDQALQTRGVANSNETLSPLYRPSSTGPQSPASVPVTAGGLIKRVKSLRVGSKKRTEA